MGTISVSQPRLYRRASLINERRLDVEWLNQLLEGSKTIDFKPEIAREVEQITGFAGALGLSFEPAAALTCRPARSGWLAGELTVTNDGSWPGPFFGRAPSKLKFTQPICCANVRSLAGRRTHAAGHFPSLTCGRFLDHHFNTETATCSVDERALEVSGGCRQLRFDHCAGPSTV